MIGLLAVVSLFSGCIYLRLLALKRQLTDFDRNFSVQTTGDVRIDCHEPVLLSDDIRWIGVGPETVRKEGDVEHWTVRWVKQLPRGVAERTTYDVEVGFTFTHGRLSSVLIPERYFEFVPKPFFLDALRALGGAKVNKGTRSVEARVSGGATEQDLAHALAGRPTLTAMGSIFGLPTDRRSDETETVLHYRYTPTVAGTRNGVFDLTFHFASDTGEMLRFDGRTPVGRMSFNFVSSSKSSSSGQNGSP